MGSKLWLNVIIFEMKHSSRNCFTRIRRRLDNNRQQNNEIFTTHPCLLEYQLEYHKNNSTLMSKRDKKKLCVSRRKTLNFKQTNSSF